MIHIFGFIGNFFFLIGAILLAKKKMSGWYAQISANMCYVVVSCFMGFEALSLGILSLILISTNIYGIIQWRKGNG